jgi:phytoene dehydrogenase-like protein
MALDRTGGRAALVIGAGANGLVAAAALARRGVAVTVLERAPGPGGMAAGAGGPAELAGFVRGPHDAGLAELGLSRDDLRLGPALPTVALDPEGRHVVIGPGGLRFPDGAPHPDAAAFAALTERLARFACALAPLLVTAPPRLGGWRSREGVAGLSRLARLGFDLRRLGQRDMREFLRIALSNAHDVILDALPDGPAAGALALDAVLGSRMGPRSPGTVVTLLYRLMQGTLHRPEGGMAGLAGRLAAAAEARGAELRYGAGAAGIEVADDRVRAVRLEGGGRIPAAAVLSSLGALPTLRLAGSEHFDAETCRRIRGIRSEGVTARVEIALAARPGIPGLDALHDARLVLAPSVATVERAFDPVKYGRPSPSPVIEACLSGEPGAGARLTATVQYVPHAAGEAERAAIARSALDMLAPVMPGLEAAADPVVLLPADIERITGAPGGHWHHGEIAIDQLLTLRPADGLAQYAMGLPGLYLCGAGAHPGGDVTGLPGRNAAHAALAEIRA